VAVNDERCALAVVVGRHWLVLDQSDLEFLDGIIERCVMHSNEVPDFNSITPDEWDALSKSDRAAFSKTKSYKEKAREFRSRWEQNPAAQAAIVKAFSAAIADLDGVRLIVSNGSPDSVAIHALLMHLWSAFFDKTVQASPKVFSAVSGVINAITEATYGSDANDIIDIAAALAKPARTSTNRKNAKKPRASITKKGDGLTLFKKWLLDPAIYKNRAAFKRDVIEKEYCKDAATAGKWLKEFIDDGNRPTEWDAAHMKT
jgi:hypothetical protein